jgi:hypothetical protein
VRGRGRARSFVAVAEWVADLPESLADRLGTSQRCPSESTIRRAVGARNADAFDAVIGGFIQQLCAAVPVKGRPCHHRTPSRRLARM